MPCPSPGKQPAGFREFACTHTPPLALLGSTPMTVLRTAPARSGSSEHSVVLSFDCLFFRVMLLAVHHLNPAPRLVPNRKTLTQIESRQPAGPGFSPWAGSP